MFYTTFWYTDIQRRTLKYAAVYAVWALITSKKSIPQAVDEVVVPRSFREGRRRVSLAGGVFGAVQWSQSWCSGWEPPLFYLCDALYSRIWARSDSPTSTLSKSHYTLNWNFLMYFWALGLWNWEDTDSESKNKAFLNLLGLICRLDGILMAVSVGTVARLTKAT